MRKSPAQRHLGNLPCGLVPPSSPPSGRPRAQGPGGGASIGLDLEQSVLSLREDKKPPFSWLGL